MVYFLNRTLFRGTARISKVKSYYEPPPAITRNTLAFLSGMIMLDDCCYFVTVFWNKLNYVSVK